MDAGSTRHDPAAPTAGVASAVAIRRLLGEVGISSAEKRTHDCARPVRLRGSTKLVNQATGEVRTVYSSGQEVDGYTQVPCGNRRATVCESCSSTYKRDAWGLIVTGLAGGKGIPAAVADHPCTFATLIRLDGPAGPDGPAPQLPLKTADLEEAIRAAANRVRVDSAPLEDGRVYRLRWGAQVDTRTITDTADRDGVSTSSTTRMDGSISREVGSTGRGVVHPEQVAAYLAKYLTKATEDFGLPAQVRSAAHARANGASAHAVRIVATAEDLAAQGEDYGLLLSHLGTLGYRGHPITKSRAYSVTFGQIRRARRRYRANPAGLSPDADIRELLDDDLDVADGFELVSSWEFAGQGYLNLDQAAAAVEAAARLAPDRVGDHIHPPHPRSSDEKTGSRTGADARAALDHPASFGVSRRPGRDALPMALLREGTTALQGGQAPAVRPARGDALARGIGGLKWETSRSVRTVVGGPGTEIRRGGNARGTSAARSTQNGGWCR